LLSFPQKELTVTVPCNNIRPSGKLNTKTDTERRNTFRKPINSAVYHCTHNAIRGSIPHRNDKTNTPIKSLFYSPHLLRHMSAKSTRIQCTVSTIKRKKFNVCAVPFFPIRFFLSHTSVPGPWNKRIGNQLLVPSPSQTRTSQHEGTSRGGL
jgi:hypothetical protein